VGVGKWLDDRTGYKAIGESAFGEPVRGGASVAYVFGSALAMMFAMQVATGVLLALFYSPSTTHAWGSIHYIEHDVLLGWFVRGLHHYGSSAMIILVICHMFQTFLYRAYAAPREVNWWTGLVLLGIVLGFSVTGYLLPWDQKGFWATRVVTSILCAIPWIGTWLKTTLQGGNDLGNLTLTRFFGFHVFILPALLGLFVAVPIAVFRRHGVTVRSGRKAADVDARTESFWPRQVTYDAAFFCTDRRDPRGRHTRAPWCLPGGTGGSGVGLSGTSRVVLPVALRATEGFLALLPVVDRWSSLTPRSRWPHFAIAGGIAMAVLALTVIPMVEDARDPVLAAQEAGFARDAERAFQLAEKGIPPGGAGELYLNDPHERGSRLFATQCQVCHRVGGKGGDAAPDLTGVMTESWIRGVTADPTQPRFFGHTTVTGMPKTDATPQEIDALTRYEMSLGGTGIAPKGSAQLFEDSGCHNCHSLADEKPRMGPSLVGYGSRAWLVGAIKEPGAAAYYGDQNKMPAFAGKLTDGQLDDLVTYMSSSDTPITGR
jgi:quinol-cytochrome oxidoreductase complex cytochrome b subunit/cytochrome c2